MGNPGDDGRWTLLRAVAAIGVGLCGAALIWLFAPYVNLIIGATNITDHYLPPAALALTFLLVLLVNPALRLLSPRLVLNARQLALAMGIFLMACVTPGMGLLSHFPYVLGQAPVSVSTNRTLAAAYEQVDLKPWLFPDKLEYGADVLVAEWFIRDLPPGESVPWAAWLPPLLGGDHAPFDGWGALLVSSWLMMIGLGMIVYPQWRRNERLAFPLVEVYRSIVEAPEPGRSVPPLFRSRLFWIAVACVFWLEMQEVAQLYLPASVPAIPLRWDLTNLFTEEPLLYLPWFVMRAHIIFVLIGVAYFMPTRISFSIWFFVLAYALYQMLATAYMPPFQQHIVTEHRFGALIGYSAGVLYLGRAHWARVFGCLLRRARSEQDKRERHAAIVFLTGVLGMIVWLTGVAGVSLGWSILLVGFGFMVSLIIARIVCETGMPYLRLDYRYQMTWIKLAPMPWISPALIYFAMIISMLFPLSSVMSPTTMTTQIAGFDEKARPRQQIWLTWVLLAVLVMGVVVSGASHLWCNYHHASTLDGMTQPVSLWGTRRMATAEKDLMAYADGHLNKPMYNLGFHIGFGATLAGALHYLSFTIPKWPIHPVGLLIVYSWFSWVAWPSVFLGWVVKILILRYGGARLYRAARPVFIGIIVGTVLAAIAKTAIPVILVMLDKPYMNFSS